MRAVRKLLLYVVGSTLAGPLAAAAPTVPFDAAQAAWFRTIGRNRLTGTATVKAADGTLHDCAHGTVQLSPVTGYTTERVRIVFGSADPDFVSVARMPVPPKPDPAGQAYQTTGRCDDSGRFAFENLPDGEYFLVVEVAWPSPGGTDVGGGMKLDGGAFGRRPHLHGSETRTVRLSR